MWPIQCNVLWERIYSIGKWNKQYSIQSQLVYNVSISNYTQTVKQPFEGDMVDILPLFKMKFQPFEALI